MRAHPARRAASRAGEQRIRLLRIRALLAGGLVLGAGATSTLASWNDAEYARGSFTAARFGVEGSLDGTTYSEHAGANVAVLNFSPAATGLFPGSTSYAGFAVRATTGSIAGQVRVAAGTPSGALSDLRYGVRTVSAMAQCSAAGYPGGGSVIADGSPLGASATIPQTLLADATPIYYCFAISLPMGASNGMQGQAIAQTWQFIATSG